MAKMIPTELEDHIVNDVFRKAEITFYNECKSLPDNWYVLYGVIWVRNDDRRVSTEGEADFVIIGPEIGLVVIEVKGGGISREGDYWYTTDRNNIKHPIKNPILQAITCKHNFVSYLKSNEFFSRRFFKATHMVCYPNVSVNDITEYIDSPKELQIAYEDLNNLKQKIEIAVNYSNQKNISALTEEECYKMANLLKPIQNMPGKWSIIAKMQTNIIEKLTEEQINVLELLDSNRIIGITGPAGSGKTITAIKWAQIQLRKGNSVIVILPTKLLKQYYNTMLFGQNITIIDFNDIEHYLFKTKANWDLIIIDESQNLSIDNWDIVEKTLNCSKKTSLLLLYDSNQRLRKKDSFYLPNHITELYLKKIIRNTKQIAQYSKNFFSDPRKEIYISGPDGLEVQKIRINSDNEIPYAVSKFIINLINNEGFDFSDIVVLFAKSGGTIIKKGKLFNGISFRSIQINYSLINKIPIINCGSVKSFIGMESSVVILIELDKLTDFDIVEACYTGISRARNLLAIVAQEQTLSKIN
jgi:hypothetical protein